ncbi:hypothetical protein SAMN04487943_101536 [Gracilibacillus orientalis]|uniref:DUF2975 domain-containing protein n=1 Tax=Gracilibacillus orientalis TaxID=334253 RepID=A0A1I4HMQ0_9BACI|nr:DUF2975 domain-containing protein [Gracilibacillus orientalis]SFL43529.1 hypothetical protein SAMN04487943_101536 [Gracilibacillus orientalis]
MNLLFKVAYLICRILFILVIPIALFGILYHIAYVFFPHSNFAASFGNFEPIFSYLTIEFEKQLDLFMKTEIRTLSFIGTVSLFILALFVLRILDKLFQNVYKHSLFMEENVNLFYKMGILILSLGTIFCYIDGLLFNKTIEALHITNASIQFSNFSYLDSILSGAVCLLIGAALKVAVKAVEENKYTI